MRSKVFLPLLFFLLLRLYAQNVDDIRFIELGANYVEFQTQTPAVENYFLDSSYSIENPPSYKKELPPTDRNFMGLKAYGSIATPCTGIFVNNTLFLSKRALYYTDKESIPGIHAIAYIYDLRQKHPIDEVILTKVVNRFLFQITEWDSSVQTHFQILQGRFYFKPQIGLMFGKVFESCQNRLHFFYLMGAPVEELRHFCSAVTLKGFGPKLGLTIDFRPFRDTFLINGIKITSFFTLSNLFTKAVVDNDFLIEDGGYQVPLTLNRTLEQLLIPVLDLGIGVSYDRSLSLFSHRLFSIKLEAGFFLKSWIGSDKFFLGTGYARGSESLSMKGWSAGASIDF
ncbi:MAG: hypothetical protein FJZ60_00315 [Chlamydiae bacterium]|nr:hypothetical protein [Chlamydiota bacterium]